MRCKSSRANESRHSPDTCRHVGKLFCALAITALSVTDALALPIIGGPTYSPAAGGYSTPTLFEPPIPGATAGNGRGIGAFTKTSAGKQLGYRAVRWDNSGFAELENVGTSTTGVTTTVAYKIGPSGEMIGYSNQYSGNMNLGGRPVIWDHSGVISRVLPVLNGGGTYTVTAQADDINRFGIVVGDSTAFNGSGIRPVRWDANGVATELDNLGLSSTQSTTSQAMAINDASVAVGFATLYSTQHVDLGRRAVRWNANGTGATQLDELGTDLNGVSFSQAIDMNQSGTAIGTSTKYGSDHSSIGDVAVRWDADGTAAIELPQITTGPLSEIGSDATAINSAGTIVGYSTKLYAFGNPEFHATRWTAGQTVATELVAAPSSTTGTFSDALDVNELGAAVGYQSERPPPNQTKNLAVAWRPDASVIDLSSLIPQASGWVQLRRAVDVNDAGWVTGIGSFDPDGTGPLAAYDRAFLMLVPDLGTYGLGDANFDTHTDFNDLVILAQHYNESNPTQNTNVADFDLNGVTDFNDLVTLAQHYTSAGTSLEGFDSAFASDWALAQSLVPEPTALALLGMAASLASRRLKR